MFYVCMSCGKYNLTRNACSMCGCTNTRGAKFAGNLIDADIVMLTHKLWSSKFYHYICVQPVDIISVLLFNYEEQDAYPFLHEMKSRAIERNWDDVSDDPREAAKIFPTPEITLKIKQEKAIAEFRRQRELERIAADEAALNAYPAWFKTFKQKFKDKPVYVQYAPSFEDSGRTFAFHLKNVATNEKQTVTFDVSQCFDIDITQSSVFRLNKTINQSCVGVKDPEDLIFRVLRSYSKQHADPNRLYFSTVLT